MPHHAGYFVLAYSWDHHCQRLFESLETKFRHVEREVSELERDEAHTTEELLNYYKKWHYNNELHHTTMEAVRRKEFIINSLGYRGYGVNRDLLGALGSLRGRFGSLEKSLAMTFESRVPLAQALIYLPRELVAERNSGYVIYELYKKLGRNPDSNILPHVEGDAELNLDRYFHVMSQEMSYQTNNAIFRKMFFSAGSSSMTLMKGSTGLHNGHSDRDLKLMANRNFVETGREIFSHLHEFTEIDIRLLERLHHRLSNGLADDAGSFRRIDFPDRNGVTLEFGNFQRELSDLAIVLHETASSFHHLYDFIYNLARAYYMFIGIHPFWDGNGRVGRCFLNYMFLKKGLPPVTFHDDEEVLSLPRYGGSMEDMHAYLKRRLRRAVDFYFYELWKLDSFGLLRSPIYNICFDSGFHFQQIGGGTPRIEVRFEAYVAEESTACLLRERCRIAVPETRLLGDLSVYCGFCHGPFTEWRDTMDIRNNLYTKELHSDMEGVRVFEADFIVEVPRGIQNGDYFSCSLACHEKGLIFNNKGLNYSYRIQA